MIDVVFVVEGKEFFVYWNVLVVNLDYFMVMFSGYMVIMSDKVFVEEIIVIVMEIFLDFIYWGEILIIEENVEDVFCGLCLFLFEFVI